MTATSVVVARHWRAEVADVADTVRAAVAADGRRDVRVHGGGRLPHPGTWGRRADVVLLSDAQCVPADLLHRRLGDPQVVRLWWNGADEVRARAAEAPAEAAAERHVVFFPDVAADLADVDLDVCYVPYAFAPPSDVRAPLDPVIGHTGEVDISDACFDGIAGWTSSALGAEAQALAVAIVAGEARLVEADERIATLDGLDAAGRATVLWSVRNRVRHQLVAAVAEAFPGRLRLRGDDWGRLGFDAAPTSFSRKRRVADYRSHRVSLDLGSKSTHAALYPRSAEILGLGGGIAQLDTGSPLDHGPVALGARRVASAEAIVELVGSMLAASEADLRAANDELRRQYEAVRLDAGRQLIDAIVRPPGDRRSDPATAAGPSGPKGPTPP